MNNRLLAIIVIVAVNVWLSFSASIRRRRNHGRLAVRSDQNRAAIRLFNYSAAVWHHPDFR